MYRYIIAGIIITSLSCQSRSIQTSETTSAPEIISSPNTEIRSESPELIESFSDDKRVGVPRKNKIEINRYARSEDNLTVIKFYTLGDDRQWLLKQTLEFDKNYGPGFKPKIEDFNNDGLKDVSFVSNVAARLANEVRRLLIYDKRSDKLVDILNSEEYPNLGYNKRLNCIDSFMITGSSMTVFLKLDGDMLKEFASVSTGLERVVSVIDKDGQERIVSRKKMREDDIYTRYVTFDPPR
ncbi:MAG: hypothetical protein IPI64_09165 [Chloracidobacterium sp.]|nr:hypothetical protein [Chloracidobacterium sp.]